MQRWSRGLLRSLCGWDAERARGRASLRDAGRVSNRSEARGGSVWASPGSPWASYFCCSLTGLVALPAAASNLMSLECTVDIGVDRRETQLSVKQWGWFADERSLLVLHYVATAFFFFFPPILVVSNDRCRESNDVQVDWLLSGSLLNLRVQTRPTLPSASVSSGYQPQGTLHGENDQYSL